LKFNLFNRDHTPVQVMPDLEYTVGPYSWDAEGGPKEATILARGRSDELFKLVNYLRGGVEILNDAGECVWWGYLPKVDIAAGRFRFGVDVAKMSNRAAVAYIDQSERKTTEWSADAASVAEFGTKEILLSRADATTADALGMRDTYLAHARRPGSTLRFAQPQEGEAIITCRGWLETLDWIYYANLTGKESYEVSGDGGREIGEDDRPILGQSFQLAAATAWTANAIWLKPWWQGEEQPADNLVVTLRSDSGGNPGAVLASGLVAGGSLGQYAEWTEFTLDTAVTLQPATTYWIHVARSGAVDADAYYMVDTNLDAGYPRGLVKLWNTNLGAWVIDIGWWGDLLFRVVGVQESTAQIATLVATCGQFLTGTQIETPSGVTSNPYRDGDTGGLYELRKLLAAGTSNQRRLLAEVTRARQLRVYEEPAQPASPADTLGIDATGKLTAAKQTAYDDSLCPVGVWCHLVDVVPASVDFSLLADPTVFFIEEASYDPASGAYRVLRTRDQLDLFDIGGTVQG
jgi:hypothetical protein